MADDSFYEEENADFSKSLGEFRTGNPKYNRFQRQFVHLSPERSKFKKTVETVLCVHGWKTPDRKVPMTLVVFGIDLECNAEEFRFQSVRIWLGFHEDDQGDAAAPKAKPKVVAFAPFVRRQEWNQSDGEVVDTKGHDFTAGVEYVGKADITTKRGEQVSYTRRYFDHGTATRLVDESDERIYGVEWYLEQNTLQRFGVKPHFHVAALVERQHAEDGTPVIFRADYDMRIEAGFRHGIEQGFRRAFRLLKPEDAPVYFNPSIEDPMVHGLEDDGKRFLERLRKDELGKLAEGENLTKLLDLDGHVMPGLEPVLAPVLE